VGRAGNKFVKQIDDVHVGGIWRGKEVVVGLILGLLEILTSKAVRLEREGYGNRDFISKLMQS
jgi:hypothetical protein